MDFRPDYLNQLNLIASIEAGFLGRIKGLDLRLKREEALERIAPHHREMVGHMGFQWDQLFRAEQVHGNQITEVFTSGSKPVSKGSDGLMTRVKGKLLGVYVADCGALYFFDKKVGGIALVHSGKKGTGANILANTIDKMQRNWGSDPRDIQIVLAPCIRPPHYEVDFAATIARQAADAGVNKKNFLDCGICTATQVGDFYSYRLESGRTGRNFALFGLR